MRYYKISQCGDTDNVVYITGLNVAELEGKAGAVCRVKHSEKSVFLNFYEKPVPIVSDNMRKTIGTYQPGAIGAPMALIDMDRQFSALYWLLTLENIPCGFENSKIILDARSIEGRKIFKVRSGIMDYVIADFDLAEAIRRDLNVDIVLEEVLANGR